MQTKTEWARGREWWVTRNKPDGGFVLIREEAIHQAWQSLRGGTIDWTGFRTWLACFEMVERRLACRDQRTPDYDATELAALLGTQDAASVRTALRRLRSAGLVAWKAPNLSLLGGRKSTLTAKGRWVPFPRRLLRHLVRSRGRAYVATALGHVLRCVYFRSGQCVSGGYVKTSWVCETFDISERAAKEARGLLAAAGWLSVLDAAQTRLNRYGAPVVVKLSGLPDRDSALQEAECTPQSAPPDKHIKLSSRRSDHPQPAAGASDASGIGKARMNRPRLSDVQPQDLHDPARTVALFAQAERQGLVTRSEADKLNFLAAAEHAKRIATRNVGGLFATIVRKRFYKVISHEDEDAGRRVMRHLREQKTRIDQTPRIVTDLLNRLNRQGPAAAVPPPSLSGWEFMPRPAAAGEGSPAPR
jgi:hypothetical protein